MIQRKGNITEELWYDCWKIARVDLLTGAYRFYKIDMTPEEYDCMRSRSITGYLRTAAQQGRIHPDDVRVYLSMADGERLTRLLSITERKLSACFRALIAGRYVWISLEILFSEHFSPAAPEVLLLWRYADPATCAAQEAMQMLFRDFHTILKINLSSDSFLFVKSTLCPAVFIHADCATLRQLLDGFVRQSRILEADREAMRRFCDVKNLQRIFRAHRRPISCAYRYRLDGAVRWSLMELFPSADYTEECQTLMLYIRNLYEHQLSVPNERDMLDYVRAPGGLRHPEKDITPLWPPRPMGLWDGASAAPDPYV